MNEALAKMDERFSAMCEADIKGGRPSIASEKLMRAMLLQVLYSVRSEWQLVEQINYNLLFRWFVDLSIDDSVRNHSVFSKNRDRMIEHDVVIKLFNLTVDITNAKDLLLGEHFSVDGTQIKAWAGHKSMPFAAAPGSKASEGDLMFRRTQRCLLDDAQLDGAV